MKAYDIEFSHMYSDDHFNIEQIQSIIEVKKIIKTKELNPEDVTLTILIDDYNSTNNSFDQMKFKKLLTDEYGLEIDSLVFESTLIDLANHLLKKIDPNCIHSESFKNKKVYFLSFNNEKISIKEMINGKEKLNCCLLAAAWILYRFGYSTELNSIQNYNLITILPKKYQSNEEKALNILKACNFDELTNKIFYHFF
jgi:hypothetical protein